MKAVDDDQFFFFFQQNVIMDLNYGLNVCLWGKPLSRGGYFTKCYKIACVTRAFAYNWIF